MEMTLVLTSELPRNTTLPGPSKQVRRNENPAVAEIVPMICARLTASQHPLARRRLPAGAAVFAEDEFVEHVHVLIDGWAVKYVTLLDGRRQILDFALPGEVLGVLGTSRVRHGVDMLCGGHVLTIPRHLFEQQLLEDPRAALMLARHLEAAESRAYGHVANMGCRSARIRVCRLLHELVCRLRAGPPATRDVHVRLPLRQSHIADTVSLRQETVCRVLVQLRAQGIAMLRKNILEIPDLQALAQAAELGLPSSSGLLHTAMPVLAAD
jgi:CRP/FNR family transcriptional regulator, anaerobic regulatory protein